MTLGIGLGLRLTGRPERVVVKEIAVPATAPFLRNDAKLEHIGLAKRELGILELIAAGLSTREIAERMTRMQCEPA